jgi:hypothetical protein
VILKTTNGGSNWVKQTPITGNPLQGVYFPADAVTGYAVGDNGTILKTTDGGGSFVEQTTEVRGQRVEVRLMVKPNPFTSFAMIPGWEKEAFELYDIAGRKVGTYWGNRIGANLPTGVYFLRTSGKTFTPVRIVKVR